MRAGQSVVNAAHSSYEHWSAHVQAQLDLDSGKNTLRQTEAIWARTKVHGSSDVRAFSKAKRRYDKTTKACGSMPRDMGRPYGSAVKRCAKRANAISGAVSIGAKVTADWDAHVKMMARKEKIPGWTYHTMWRSMIRKAPPHLHAFAKAYRAYQKAPSCVVPS